LLDVFWNLEIVFQSRSLIEDPEEENELIAIAMRKKRERHGTMQQSRNA
jgi:hypothetical protein